MKTLHVNAVVGNIVKGSNFSVNYITDDTLYHYVKDHQGNVRCVVRDDGAVVESNQYYPYGGSDGVARQRAAAQVRRPTFSSPKWALQRRL